MFISYRENRSTCAGRIFIPSEAILRDVNVCLRGAAAGSGFWDTPMSRHLFEGRKQSADPGNMYFAMLRMPLSGVFW